MLLPRLMNRLALQRHFSTLIVAQPPNPSNLTTLSKNNLKLITAANKLNDGTGCTLFIAGKGSQKLAQQLGVKGVKGVKRVVYSEEESLYSPICPLLSAYLKANPFRHIVSLSSSYGRDIVPRLAGMWDLQPITDVVEIRSPNTYVRPSYAGNALNLVKSQQSIDFITVRASAFDVVDDSGTPNTQVTALPSVPTTQKQPTLVSRSAPTSSRPQLSTARIVVSGGRALKSKQNFNSHMYGLADAIGPEAGVGASRAAVDAGYCDNDLQVGQTGKIVCPDLYIAVGISGAVQHLAGMKDSKVIVSINNRPDEPLAELATYNLTGDLFKIIPELIQKIKKIKGK